MYLDFSIYFRRHLSIHGEKKSFNCSVCKKEYSDRSTFKRHMKEKHGENERQFGCHVCKKHFRRKETLNSHISKLHADKSETSKVETPNAKNENEVQAKAEESKTEYSFVKCPECEKTFYKKSSMEIHLRTHTGEKPYVCEQCGKKFARSNNLKLHKRIHTGYKPHKCHFHECGKSFSDISALKRHLRTHTGEKPYSCSKCPRSFSQLSTMKVHEKNCKSKNGARTTGASKDHGTFRKDPTTSSMLEDNSLSVMAGSEPPVFNTDTLDSVRASCL